jgi:hypothetical protein
LRFTLKARERLRIFADVIGEKFQGDVAVEANVLSLINHPHSAPAELLDEAVVRDDLADERLGLRHVAVILSREPKECQRL